MQFDGVPVCKLMMARETHRQITVASVLLLLVAVFTVSAPDHRCRTQSTRNRQARTVRMDDHDGDHNRWHAHGFDLSGRDASASGALGDAFAVLVRPPGILTPVFVAVDVVSSFVPFFPSRLLLGGVRGRAPPTPFQYT